MDAGHRRGDRAERRRARAVSRHDIGPEANLSDCLGVGVTRSDWQPGDPDRSNLARGVLVEVLDGLLTVNGIRLDEPSSEAGGGSTGAWDDVLRATADVAAMLARYSEVARGRSVPDGERLSDLALRGQQAITRLVGFIVIELGVPVDRAKVVDEASQLLDEVDQEDDGVWHAQDAIGSLLQARLICAEEQIEMPPAELSRASVAILAPLLAQAACLRWP